MKAKIVLLLVILFALQITTMLYGDEVRSCTHKQIYPEGFICVGEAESYQPSEKEQLPSIPEIQRENWNLI
ncbi:MAG: hypothetical protein KAW47_10940, partial [Thermoplasmatales archaeon]|nr:hypothetical protein [Thermoplasmatales archaeon]